MQPTNGSSSRQISFSGAFHSIVLGIGSLISSFMKTNRVSSGQFSMSRL
jgi:hypothetical protein